MRTTSAASYRELRESGRLEPMQAKVLDYVRAAGPVSGRQISRMVDGGHKRIAELVTLGRLEISDIKRDIHTGKRVIYWQVAKGAMLPGFPVKQARQTRKQLEERIMWLENELAAVRHSPDEREALQ